MGVQVSLRINNLEIQRHQSICCDTFQIRFNVVNIPGKVLKNGIVLAEVNFAELSVAAVGDQHLEVIPEIESSLQNPRTVYLGAMLFEPKSVKHCSELLMIVFIIRARPLISIE